MLQAAIEQLGFAPAQCLVVGDKDCDIDLGRRSGARTALVRTGYGADTEARRRCVPDVVVDGLTELASLQLASLQLAALQLAPGQGATPVGASGTGSSRSAS
jgi:D-glycero-D-manno-heptose 1,7-bisphosphate phosphatase